MNKEIYIRDFYRNKHKITIPRFEEVKGLFIEVVSGDELLVVVYTDGAVKIFNSPSSRYVSCCDYMYAVPLNRIDEFSEFAGGTYDCFWHFMVEDDE